MGLGIIKKITYLIKTSSVLLKKKEHIFYIIVLSSSKSCGYRICLLAVGDSSMYVLELSALITYVMTSGKAEI